VPLFEISGNLMQQTNNEILVEILIGGPINLQSEDTESESEYVADDDKCLCNR
jgi:hypothetical protein